MEEQSQQLVLVQIKNINLDLVHLLLGLV